jgi:translation initiation factor RLI1
LNPLFQKCPFDAIMIINLPKDLEKDTTHRYGANSFKLHRRAERSPLHVRDSLTRPQTAHPASGPGAGPGGH